MSSKKYKAPIFLVGIVTNEPDAWEILAKKESKSLQFVVPLQAYKMDKTDIKFINANLRRFIEVEPSLKEGEVMQQGN